MSALQTGTESTALLVGALTHLTRFMHTGCPRAAHQAQVLLHQFDDTELGAELALPCQIIDQAVSARCQP